MDADARASEERQCGMKRNFDLKRRESRNLPPEKLQEILSRIYPEGTVNELMKKFCEMDKQDKPTEKGGAE